MKIRQSLLDSIAIGASFACLIHCLAMPFFFAAIPALSEVFGTPELVHIIMLMIALPVSAMALVSGYRGHGAVFPAILGVTGLCLMIMAVAWPQREFSETGLTVLGSILLALGHFGNWLRLERKHYHRA